MVATTSTRGRRPDGVRLLLDSPIAGRAADVALAVVRIALAWIFIYYGAVKLFGAFPGSGVHGLHETAQYMSNSAHLHPGMLFAVLGGVIEFGGGIAVALGLGARLAGIALFGDMVMAMITVTWDTGLKSSTAPPGYQINLALAALALAVAILGAGRFSLDAQICRLLRRGATVDRWEAAG